LVDVSIDVVMPFPTVIAAAIRTEQSAAHWFLRPDGRPAQYGGGDWPFCQDDEYAPSIENTEVEQWE